MLINESKTFLSLYMRLIEINTTVAWPRSIVFEALRDIVSDFNILKSLFKYLDMNYEGTRVLSDVFACFQKTTFENLGPLNLRKNQDIKDPNAEMFSFSFATNAIKVPW